MIVKCSVDMPCVELAVSNGCVQGASRYRSCCLRTCVECFFTSVSVTYICIFTRCNWCKLITYF